MGCAARAVTVSRVSVARPTAAEIDGVVLPVVVGGPTPRRRTGVTWREIDLSERTWRVPAERMKARRIHTVPLSEQTLEILNHMKLPGSRADSLVFAVVDRNGCIRRPSQEMISDAVRKLGRKSADGRRIVAHGFRASFRVWGIEQARAPREVCEAALAHQESDRTVAAYTAEADPFDDRRELMQTWADFLLPRPSSVKE